VIRLEFTEPAEDDDEWAAWVRACRDALDAIPVGAAKPQVDSELYKTMRARFLAASHDKCAYCEVDLDPGQRQGDVEHYRPKGRVRNQRGELVKVTDGAAEADHPGYYWLAYEWRNLLPSCLACNRRAGDAATGQQTGKGEIFPTLDDWWAAKPEDVEREQPALLNPWVDDPREHLVFDPDTGIVGDRTERGRITIQILGLNHRSLPEARKRAAREAKDLYCDFLKERGQRVVNPDHVDAVAELDAGAVPYTAIRLAAIEHAWARIVGDPASVPPPGLARLAAARDI
jgi:hypothetical protein